MTILNHAYGISKEVKELGERERIRALIHSLNSVSDPADGQRAGDRSQFGYMARQQHAQFFGYLLIDNQRSQLIDAPVPFQIPELQEEERRLLARCHQLIVDLNQTLCAQLPDKFKKAADPYSRFIWSPPRCSDPLNLNGDTYSQMAEAMNTHPGIQALMHTPSELVQNIPESELHKGVLGFVHRIRSVGVSKAPDDFNSLRFLDRSSPEYLVSRLILGLVAIHMSLSVLDQMVFQALLSNKLAVLDEDNIIDITSTSHVVGEAHTVECQPASDEVFVQAGDLLLLQDIMHSTSAKKLCVVEEQTINFSRDFGDTVKFQLRSVDEDLNPFSGILNI